MPKKKSGKGKRLEEVTPESVKSSESCGDPLGGTLFRIMHALHSDEKPIPELDALPMAQLRMLFTLHHAENATMKDLSEKLGITQSSVTKLADGLERRGLIERIADSEDRRKIRLKTSETARDILQKGKESRTLKMRAVWETLFEKEQKEILIGLERLLDALETYNKAVQASLPASEPSEEGEVRTPQPVVDIMSRPVRGRAVSLEA